VQIFKQLIKKYGLHFYYHKELKSQTYTTLLNRISKVDGLPLSTAADNIFTYHGEDGIIQFLLRHLPDVPPIFIDIGSGDCIKSNCATLAIHQNWSGTFIDADKKQLSIGERFYKSLGRENLLFKNFYVDPNNINSLVKDLPFEGKVGVLSIDIDGNDYWIWNALEVIQPKIVVIEAKVEFGEKNIVVPYSKENHHSFDKMYNGASVEALKELGLKKGYTLIGAIPFGYNLFFIPTYCVQSPFHKAEANEVLQHPETQKSFYAESFFQSHQFFTG
jgi:hypothetical protein